MAAAPCVSRRTTATSSCSDGVALSGSRAASGTAPSKPSRESGRAALAAFPTGHRRLAITRFVACPPGCRGAQKEPMVIDSRLVAVRAVTTPAGSNSTGTTCWCAVAPTRNDASGISMSVRTTPDTGSTKSTRSSATYNRTSRGGRASNRTPAPCWSRPRWQSLPGAGPA